MTDTVVWLSMKELFLWGAVGGFLLEGLKYYKKFNAEKWPGKFDLAATFILLALSGVTALLYQGQVSSMYVAAQIGASSPAIIGALASGKSMPPPPGGSQSRTGGAKKGGKGGKNAGRRFIDALSWEGPPPVGKEELKPVRMPMPG